MTSPDDLRGHGRPLAVDEPPDLPRLILGHVTGGTLLDQRPLERAMALQRYGDTVTLEVDILTGQQVLYTGSTALMRVAGEVAGRVFDEASVPVSAVAMMAIRHAAGELTLTDFGPVDPTRCLLAMHHARVRGHMVTFSAYDLRPTEAVLSPLLVDDRPLGEHLERLLISEPERHGKTWRAVRTFARQADAHRTSGLHAMRQTARVAHATVPKSELALSGWATVVIPPNGEPWVLSGVPTAVSRTAYRRLKSQIRALLAEEADDPRMVHYSPWPNGGDVTVTDGSAGAWWQVDTEGGRSAATDQGDEGTDGGPRSNTAARRGYWREVEDRRVRSLDITAGVRAALEVEPLTDAEARVVVAMLAHLQGWQIPQGAQEFVAEQLEMSHASVRRHWTNARRKLQTGRLAELLHELPLVDDDRLPWSPLPSDPDRGDCPVCGGAILPGQLALSGIHSACV